MQNTKEQTCYSQEHSNCSCDEYGIRERKEEYSGYADEQKRHKGYPTDKPNWNTIFCAFAFVHLERAQYRPHAQDYCTCDYEQG